MRVLSWTTAKFSDACMTFSRADAKLIGVRMFFSLGLLDVKTPVVRARVCAISRAVVKLIAVLACF